VSAGYIAPEPRVEFFRHMDAANIDLKGFTERFYKELCSGKLAAVLETLEYLKHETKVWFEITTLLIPGENDSPAEIEAESDWLMKHLGPDVPLHFTAFHPDWKMTDRPPTPAPTHGWRGRSHSRPAFAMSIPAIFTILPGNRLFATAVAPC
jgi:pyruvate formate lyase activating enzyme